MKPTRKEIKEYFEKAPTRQKFITEMRRVIAHEMNDKSLRKMVICRTLYGNNSPNKLVYLLKHRPENKNIIKNWHIWIKKGLYPISEVEYFHVKPISKMQKVVKKTGLTQISRVVMKLVEIP